MSIGNRVKLCSGLAKLGVLGEKTFKKIYPKVVSLKIETPAWFRITGGGLNESMHLGGSEEQPDDKNKRYVKAFNPPNLCAGDVLTMQAEKGCYGHSHHVELEFVLSNGSKAICKAHAQNWTDENQNTDEFIKVLVPLADGYKYTIPIKDAFNLIHTNSCVGLYPNCREW